MVLVGSRGKLDVARRRGTKRAGVFGTLVVVLPGAFVGGDLVVNHYADLHHGHAKDDKQVKMTSSTWRPSDRPNEYCVTYAAFYDDCVYGAEPIASGAALCLVYDLLTMTPGEVPLYGGSAAIQRSIDVALENYFHVGPAPLVKRVKISDDAWRTINAFAAQRHFAYIVQGDSFEKLQGNDRLVAGNLAAFCAHSGGQYVLYHARVLCSRYSKEHKVSEYDSNFDDGNANETKVTLRAAWRKYGDAESIEFPPVYLRHAREVAPLGRVEAFPLRVRLYDLDWADRDIVSKLHGELRRTGVCPTFALVVQPAAIETTQIAQLPMEDVFTRLRSLLPHARDEALRYARQVLSHKPKWPVDRRNESELTEFVQILVVIDDLSLFKELLLSLDLRVIESDGALRSKDAYDITYTAFYNGNCSGKFRPMLVTSGAMLCLVYDLVTSTINEVPRLAGEAGLQRALEASLTHFFEVLPPHKRFKISDDSWHTINEFAVDHRFVYPITGESFASLSSDDQRVADRLAAFCTRSNGQYVLYLVKFYCVRRSFSREEDDDDTQVEFTAVFETPWYQHGDSIGVLFPSTVINHKLELAPEGFLETAEFEIEDESNDWYRKNQRYKCFALVELPATLDQALWVKLPIMDAMAKVLELVHMRPDDASRLVRRVIAYHTLAITQEVFGQLLVIVQVLNSAPLFGDLLTIASLFEFDDGSLSDAVSHFGWDACVANTERIIQTTNFRSSVNLICSVLHGSTCCNRIQQLIGQLIEVQPWPGKRDPPSSSPPYYYGSIPASRHLNPTVAELARLFALAYRASMDTLVKLLDTTASRPLAHTLVIPALVQFVGELSTGDRSPLVPMLRSMHDRIESTLPGLRNASYAAITIPDHCDRCRELQAFLLSPAPVISLRLRDKAHLKHMETAIKRKVSSADQISITHTPPNIVLTKVCMRNERSVAAEQCFASLASLITR